MTLISSTRLDLHRKRKYLGVLIIEIYVFVNTNSNCPLQQGSRLWADYEVTWEKDGFTQYSRIQTSGNGSRMKEISARQFKNEALGRQRYSGSIPDDSRRKRFKVSNHAQLMNLFARNYVRL